MIHGRGENACEETETLIFLKSLLSLGGPVNTCRMANMPNAMKPKCTMLCENSLGGYELVWKVKKFFPKEMVLVLRPGGHVGNTWGQERSESIPG